MERPKAAVSAATGALKPVLEKLAVFLGGEPSLPEGGKSDMELVKSDLELVLSVIPMIWGREDVDAPCKDWLNEARELSYDMEEAIDGLVHEKISQFPWEEMKTRARSLSERSSDMRKMAQVISSSSKPTMVDPRSRFLHRDASELVGIEEMKLDLIHLVVSGVDKWGDTPRRRPATANREERTIVFKVQMSTDKLRSIAMAIVARMDGVISICIAGIARDMLVVVGSRMDPVGMASALRQKIGGAEVVQVSVLKKNLRPAVPGYQRSDQIKTVCIQGLPGVGKTALSDVVYRATEQQFDCRAFVSVSPCPEITEILKAILIEVTNSPCAYAEAMTQQHLVNEISKFLEDKRYLVIIDDIWHWAEWEIIEKCLPKNNPSSRIIMTTRFSAIAEKCRNEDNHAFLYEIGGLDTADARKLIMNSGTRGITVNIKDYLWNDITEMCDGVPLAVNCFSSAMKELIRGSDGELEKRRALRRVKDGILTIPSLKPLADSLYLGYNDLALDLRTLLLYCSIYNWDYQFEKDRLVRRWISERFVYDKGTLEDYFEELVNSGWINPSAKGNYEIHPLMLAFLKCKSQEENFVTHMDFGSDIIPSSKRIRRLSLQHVKEGQSVKFRRLDLSHTHSLSVFGLAGAVPFKQFERLRVLELEDTGDVGDGHLRDICGLKWLRHLGLMGTPITEVPPQIKSLQDLESLDIRDTGVMELPWEACQLPKSVRVLAGNIPSRQSISLPEGVYDGLEKAITDSGSSLEECRGVLCIQLYDPSGLGTVDPRVALFKVPGLCRKIPKSITKYINVLFSLDIRLCELGEEDLKILQEMPNLKNLVVRFEVVPVEPVAIGAAGFAKLESFCVDSRVPRITFVEAKAMPKLKCLVFKFYAGPASKNPVGIKHLPMLQVVVFRCSPWYSSDSPGISATVAAIRGEAGEHDNQITLHINGKEEIFRGKQSGQDCQEAGSSGTGVVEAQEDTPSTSASASAAPNSIAGTDAIASCSRTSEIEEIQTQW